MPGEASQCCPLVDSSGRLAQLGVPTVPGCQVWLSEARWVVGDVVPDEVEAVVVVAQAGVAPDGSVKRMPEPADERVSITRLRWTSFPATRSTAESGTSYWSNPT